ncbi:MAG: hypothetical protein P1U56_04775 [Saprospiraceae bacterium]|nr:hypothetical protein [Saprospiraceae bacterium]
MTVGSILCATIFDIQDAGDGIHFTGGISGLRFDVINILSVTQTVPIGNLVLLVDKDVLNNNCPVSNVANLMTLAINETIEQIRILMQNELFYEDLTDPDTFQGILLRNISAKSADCVSHGYGGSASANVTNEPAAYTARCNTTFPVFTNNFISMNNGADCQ